MRMGGVERVAYVPQHNKQNTHFLSQLVTVPSALIAY